jgi:hypothetical protein
MTVGKDAMADGSSLVAKQPLSHEVSCRTALRKSGWNTLKARLRPGTEPAGLGEGGGDGGGGLGGGGLGGGSSAGSNGELGATEQSKPKYPLIHEQV